MQTTLPEQQRFTRRDVLTGNFSKSGVQSPAREQHPFSPEQKIFAEIDSKVADKINEVLGLTSADVQVFIRPGNHIIDEVHQEFISAQQITHIAGELDIEGLFESYSRAMSPTKNTLRQHMLYAVESIFNPGIGSPHEAMQRHDLRIKQLIDEGVRLSALDGSGSQIFQLWGEDVPESIATVATFGLIVALTGIVASQIPKGRINRRQFLALSTAVAGVAVGTLASTGWKQSWRHSLGNQGAVDVQIVYDKVRAGQSDERLSAFGSFNELLIRRRNEIMTLNLWSVLSRIKDFTGGSKEAMLMFMGTAHSEIIDLFLLGPDEVQHKVKTFAELLLTDGLDYLVAEAEENSTVYPQDVLLSWFKLFSDAQTIGVQHSISFDTAQQALPTARTIFVEELLREIEDEKKQNTNIPTERYTRLSRLLEVVQDYIEVECTSKVFELQGKNTPAVLTEQQRTIELPQQVGQQLLSGMVYGEHAVRTFIDQSTALARGESHDGSIATELRIQRRGNVLTGLCAFGGQLHVCKRVLFRTLDGTIVSKDELQLLDGTRYYFNRHEFYQAAQENIVSDQARNEQFIFEIACGVYGSSPYSNRMSVTLIMRDPSRFGSELPQVFISQTSNSSDSLPTTVLSFDSMHELITDFE